MDGITYIKYTLDKEYLLKLADSLKKESSPYIDPRYDNKPLETWRILKISDTYVDTIMQEFGVKGKARFYWQEANSVLPMHTDNGTTCSINFVLSDNPAPVTIEDKDYYYEQAVLDTTRMHGVTTLSSERILLKISVFDTPYEEFVDRISEYVV